MNAPGGVRSEGEEPLSSGGGAKRPLGNFVTLGSGELLARVVAFAVTATLTRRVGAAGFGELAFATAITGYLLLVPNLALGDLAGRAVARAPDSAGRIVASVTRIRLVVAGAGVVVVGLLALVLPVSPTVRALIVLSALSALPQAVNAAWGYKALERTARIGLGLTLAQLVTLAWVLAFVHDPQDVLRVPVAQALGEVAIAVILLPVVVVAWRAGSLREGIRLLRGANAAVLGRMLRTLIVTADMVMLGFLADASKVGLYSAGYRVCFLLTVIASSAHVVFKPALMRAHEDAVRASSVLTDALWVSWAVGLPLVVGGIVVAPDLLALLFGEPFREGYLAFRILLVSIGFLFLHGAVAGSFLARNQLALHARIFGAAAVLNLLLNALLIRTIDIVGAALATATAEGLILICSIVVLYRWNWRPRLRQLLNPLLAVIGMLIGLAVMSPEWHVLVRITLAGVIYVALLLIGGGVPSRLRPGDRGQIETSDGMSGVSP